MGFEKRPGNSAWCGGGSMWPHIAREYTVLPLRLLQLPITPSTPLMYSACDVECRCTGIGCVPAAVVAVSPSPMTKRLANGASQGATSMVIMPEPYPFPNHLGSFSPGRSSMPNCSPEARARSICCDTEPPGLFFPIESLFIRGWLSIRKA